MLLGDSYEAFSMIITFFMITVQEVAIDHSFRRFFVMVSYLVTWILKGNRWN